jgi:hypothetical protein
MKLEAALNLALYTSEEFIYDTYLCHVHTIENTGEEYVLRHYRIFEHKKNVHLPWVKEHGVLIYIQHKPFYNRTKKSIKSVKKPRESVCCNTLTCFYNTNNTK